MRLAFTSVNYNYLDKAIALFKSIRKFHRDIRCVVVFSESKMEFRGNEIPLLDELGIEVIYAEDLDIPSFRLWASCHSVVELCTAVKPFAFRKFCADAENKILYFDPDMLIFSSLDSLYERLDTYGVLLVPHQNKVSHFENDIEPEKTSAQFGIYNLGFLGISAGIGSGPSFVDWWAERCYHYCFDDRSQGIFTDQKWCDAAPALFDDVLVLRDDGCDVASWNLHHRRLWLDAAGQLKANSSDLIFYHFSSFDNGDGRLAALNIPDNAVAAYELFKNYDHRLRQIQSSINFSRRKWTLSRESLGVPEVEALEFKSRLIGRSAS